MFLFYLTPLNTSFYIRNIETYNSTLLYLSVDTPLIDTTKVNSYINISNNNIVLDTIQSTSYYSLVTLGDFYFKNFTLLL
jgi:hypothetical protein